MIVLQPEFPLERPYFMHIRVSALQQTTPDTKNVAATLNLKRHRHLAHAGPNRHTLPMLPRSPLLLCSWPLSQLCHQPKDMVTSFPRSLLLPGTVTGRLVACSPNPTSAR